MEPTTKKKKLVEIAITGTEKCLDARDETGDSILLFSKFACDDYLVFEVDGNEYHIEDFEKDELECDKNEVDVAEFFEEEEASTGILYTNKAVCGFSIEIDEDEEFDPQKVRIVCSDFIYTNDTDEPMLDAFVYDGVTYDDFFIETAKEYDEEQVWPISDDDDDWCDDEDDEDDV